MNLSGIFPPIATPFVMDRVATSHLAENVRQLMKTGIRGIVALGSNGESVSLTKMEKLAVLEHARNAMPDDAPLLAGTGGDSLPETIELTNGAFECGANAALVFNPVFYRDKMTHQSLVQYFRKLADNSRIPIVLYNVPKYTGYNISAETVAALAEHPNIIGIKSSSENIGHLGEILRVVPADFSVLIGTGSVLFPALTLGAIGGVLAIANVASAQCVQLQQWVAEGNWAKACDLQLQLIPVNKALTATYGIAGLKVAQELIGLYGGVPRLPLSPIGETEKAQLRQILQTAGLIS